MIDVLLEEASDVAERLKEVESTEPIEPNKPPFKPRGAQVHKPTREAKQRRGRKPPAPKKNAGNKPKSSTAAAPAAPKIKKPHRFRPGTQALREIRRYQKTTELLLRKQPFYRLVREVSEAVASAKQLAFVPRWQASALVALQESTEVYVIAFFQGIQLCAIHAKRTTVMPKDVGLWKRLVSWKER